MQNIPCFILQTEWFLVNFSKVRAGAGLVGNLCKVHLHSTFVYLQSNTMLLAVCITLLLGSVYSELTSRKCLNHMARTVH